MSIRIMLVDDHPLVRTGMRTLLETDPRVRVIAEAESGEEAPARLDELAASSEGGPQLVLMDLQLGTGTGGIETTRRVRAAPPGTQVLTVTTFDAEADIVGYREAGAVGCMLKDSPTDALIAAVFKAAAGRSALSPDMQQRLVRRLADPRRALSPREVEILEALASGASNREIAREMFLSESTVKTRLAHLYDKLGVDSRTADLRVARDRRLIR